MDKHIRQLERLLHEQLETNDQLLTLLRRKREVLNTAQHDNLAQLCGLENQKVQRIADLEKQRLELVGEITLMLEPGATEPWHLQRIAESLAEPGRGRLLVLRANLRQKMQEVLAETQVLRRVTETVHRHMQGMLQSIGAACTGVLTYGHRGMRPKSSTALSTFNATA